MGYWKRVWAALIGDRTLDDLYNEIYEAHVKLRNNFNVAVEGRQKDFTEHREQLEALNKRVQSLDEANVLCSEENEKLRKDNADLLKERASRAAAPKKRAAAGKAVSKQITLTKRLRKALATHPTK